jgi:hypothetical protein
VNVEGPNNRNEVLERVLAQWPEGYHGRIVTLLQLQGNLLEKHAGSWGLFPASTAGHWVVATNDSEGERRARETVEAFVGPLTGSISIGSRPGGGDDSGEAWLATQGATTLFDLVPGDDREGLLPAIELLVTVRSNQPPSNRNFDEPVQFLIREFYLALHNGNTEASVDLLRRIEVTGRLSALNLLFLKVERLARFKHWDQLEQLEEFEDLAVRQRPRRISENLLEALWHTRISSRNVDEPAVIRNRFHEIGVAAGYAHLLGAIDVPASFEARCVVALFCQETDDPDRLARVIASATQAEGELLRQLVGLQHDDQPEHETVPPPHLRDSPVNACHKAFNACEYSKVLDVAEEHPDEPECRPLAVRAASESGDRELCSRVVELIGADGSVQLTGDDLLSRLSREEATDLLRRLSLPEAEQFRLLLLQVIRIAEHRCTGWVEWMERVAGDEPWTMGATVARGDAAAWAVDELLVGSMPGRASELLLDGISGVNRKELLGALDLLCDLYANIVRHSASGPIRTAIIMLLSEADRPSPQVREAFLTLSSANLDGADAASYKSFVETAKAIWEEVKSDAALDWALSFADHLLAVAPPDPQIRVDFINQIVVWVWEDECRFTEWQRNWLSLICKDANISTELKPAAEPRQGELIEASCWDRLTGKLVGLYMLDERTASRFKALLPKRSPGAEPVETDSSHADNEILRGIAQRSDYMIVCRQCSKHPATECIDAVRKGRPQIWPDGRRCPGITGLFRCLENVLQAELDGESEPVGL